MYTSKKRFVVLILCGVFSFNSRGGDRFVEATGELRIKFELWSTNNTKPPKIGEWRMPFSAIVGTNQWMLNGEFAANGTEKWFFDGTNVLRSSRITKRLGTNDDDFVGMSLEEARSNVTINVYSTEGGYLPGEVGENIAWLALCSGPYLHRSGRIVPLPVVIIRHAPDAFGYADRTEVFSDELGLPKTMDLLTSMRLYEESAAAFWHDRPLKNKQLLRASRPDGLVRFKYWADSYTNFFGWTFPLQFSFSEEIPDEYGATRRRHSGSGVVRALGFSGAPPGVFEPNLKQTILDRRYENVKPANGIMYAWTNSYLAPSNDPRLQQNLKSTIERVKAARFRRTGRTWLMYGTLAFALGLPLLIFRLASLRERRKTHM